MIDDIKELLSPFRLVDTPTMYQGLPNIRPSKDGGKVVSEPPPRPGKTKEGHSAPQKKPTKPTPKRDTGKK